MTAAAGMRDKPLAVPHVDGSARRQTVSQAVNPMYHDLIVKLDGKTGASPVLNARLNLMREPVVQSAVNALHCFFFTGLDALAPGSNLVRKT